MWRDHHSSISMVRVIIPVLLITLLVVILYVINIAPHILQANNPPFKLHNRNFIGTWHSHANVLIIKQDGHAHFVGRVYRWCTEGPPPCDKMEGDIITPGIQKEIVFNHEQNNALSGTIISSTDHTDGQAVTATLGSNDTLDLNGARLCGPKAPIGTCGA